MSKKIWAVVVLGICIIVGGILYVYNANLTVHGYGGATAVFLHDKWISEDGTPERERGKCYFEVEFLYQDVVLDIPLSEECEILYDAVTLDREYSLIHFELDIPYKEAEELGLLNSRKQLIFEKVLEKAELISKYGKITHLTADYGNTQIQK